MLKGKIIINTRPEGADDSISLALEELGAVVFTMPLIEIIPINLSPKISLDILKNKIYQWLVFTSKNGIDNLFSQLKENLLTTPLPFKTAVFGERTAMSLKKWGFTPDLINTGNTSEDLLNDLLPTLQPCDRVLLVVGDLASGLLGDAIKQTAQVDRVDVYRTVFVQSLDGEILHRIKENSYDMIIFTSPSGFRSIKYHTDRVISLNKLKTACIGPTTEEAVLAEGLTPLVVARPSGKSGLISGLEQYFATR
ncbi:MAG: uroporphyrinogen-III synthase [Porphyromonadaceae bacterium]|nr:MAG: uroporphyrinogen-III synthase [Porphyromonadaceae bacterium]